MDKKEERKIKKYLETLDKKAIIDLYLQMRWDHNKEINDLNAQLADKDDELGALNYSNDKLYKSNFKMKDKFSESCKKIQELKQKLRTKIGNMKSTDFIKMCFESGFMVEAKEANNQEKINFTIEALNQLKVNLRKRVRLMDNNEHCYSQNAVLWDDIVMNIMNQIEQLKKGDGNE